MKLIIYAILLNTSFLAYSQNGRGYFYDNAGNRIQRKTVVFSGMMINNDKPKLEDAVGQYAFTLYPNTTEGNVTISAEESFMELEQKMIYVYDLAGKLILQKEYCTLEEKIDLTSAVNGTYLVKVIASGGYRAEWNVVKL